MKRKIIRIDEELCTGCGLCIPGCPEGALRVIDGKARLVGEIFCDGLGACLGNCPEGAITVEEREAEEYSERKTMDDIVKGGEKVIKAHFEHLLSHGQDLYYREASAYLKERGLPVPEVVDPAAETVLENNQPVSSTVSPVEFKGCKFTNFTFDTKNNQSSAPARNELTHWPIQMHLLNPRSPHFRGTDFILASDCSAFVLGSFHSLLLKGKTLGIACPKLDQNLEVYIDKITSLAETAMINTITVIVMDVPCCNGLLRLASEGVSRSRRKVPIKIIQLSTKGELLIEEWT